jgi:formate hydrogenlyase transcriptional activator
MPDTASSNAPGRSPGNGEARYHQIFERANDAIFLIDVERDKILDVNDRACRMLEYSREELLALPISATHPDDVARMREFVGAVLDQGSGWTNELTCVTKFGHRVPAEISASVVDMEGRTCLLGLVRPRGDYEFQKLFEWLFESTPDATLVIDARGRITLVNPQLETLFAYSRAEILGQPVEILIPERFRSNHVAHREDFHRQPRMRPMGAGLELYGKRKDGSEFAVDIELSPVTGTGLVLSVVRDVSERKREHEQLQHRAAGLQHLVEERSALLRRSEERRDVLLEVNNAIIGSLDRESLFEAIARALRNVIRFDRASITLADMSRAVSTVRALVSELVDGKLLTGLRVGTEIPHKGTRIGRVLEERRPLVVRDLSEEIVVGRQRGLVDEGLRSAIIAPLMSRHGAIGTVDIYSKAPDQYSDDDAEFLTAVGTQLAAAIENMLAYEEIAQLKASLEQENIYLQEEIKTEHPYEEIVGHSVALRKIAQTVETVAATDATVLITGETGTGKEVIARAVHNLSPRRAKTMVKVNCAALPSGLVESELFGHEKGAFTGAVARKIGRFEVAHGSTIFLDEIGDLPMDLQAKLLRVLQEGEFERVGGTTTIKVNTRVIAATNQDLATAMREGRFRPDLYYRLSVFPITLPPLRDRQEDIPPLVRHLVMKCCTKLAKRIESIPQAAMDALRAYSWPGNVRELENVIELAVILSRGPQLELGDWMPPARAAGGASGFSTLEEVERRYIRDVLDRTGWVVSGEKGAAKVLGLKPTTLEARMKKLGITRTV